MSKNDSSREVYLLTGKLDYRRQAAIDELVQGFGGSDSAIEKFDGFKATADQIIEAAATLPFLAERKIVIVDRVDRLSPDDQVRLSKFIDKLGPAIRLILMTGEIQGKQTQGRRKEDEDEEEDEAEEGEEEGKKKPKKRKKGLQRELSKAAKDHGKVLDFGKMKSSDLSAELRKGLLARGKKIEGQALSALTNSISAAPSIAECELDKLASYVGDQATITVHDVDRVVTKSPEDRVFPLIDAIAMRRPQVAIRLLSETFAASAKPDTEVLRLLSMMGRHFRLLYQAKFLQVQGVGSFKAVPEELQACLIQEKRLTPMGVADFQQKKFAEQAIAFSINEIELCLKHVLACELAAKGLGKTAASPRMNLEMLILRLSQRKKTRAA